MTVTDYCRKATFNVYLMPCKKNFLSRIHFNDKRQPSVNEAINICFFAILCRNLLFICKSPTHSLTRHEQENTNANHH